MPLESCNTTALLVYSKLTSLIKDRVTINPFHASYTRTHIASLLLILTLDFVVFTLSPFFFSLFFHFPKLFTNFSYTITKKKLNNKG